MRNLNTKYRDQDFRYWPVLVRDHAAFFKVEIAVRVRHNQIGPAVAIEISSRDPMYLVGILELPHDQPSQGGRRAQGEHGMDEPGVVTGAIIADPDELLHRRPAR